MSKVDIEEYLDSYKPMVEAILQKSLPRKISKQYVDRISGKPAFGYDTQALENGLSKPVWDFLDRGGKRWRPTMFLLLVDALGGNVEKVRDFAAVIELVHNGTIIEDDIEDGAELRRGKKCLHELFGVDTAINCGNAIYFIPLSLFVNNEQNFSSDTLVAAYNIYAREMINVHLGQAMDISWHRGEKDPALITESQYLQMCAYKTGTLARMSAKLAAVLSGARPDEVEILGKFAESIGVAFQIQDDILDIVSCGDDRDKFGKPYGNDITEGKITLLVLKTLAAADSLDRARLVDILQSHTREKSTIDEAIELINKYGAMGEAQKLAGNLVISSWEDAKRVLPEGLSRDVLESFAYYLIERNI